ncbi:von Hippel-Lindau-like protein [Chanos chanos]|uniref:von Hippel-Lindau disease tumor suppressor n=1 Tax=Chanos chanos TaxID=29144 RepID=A0A6J2WMD5_CHACN|nr:von Hippel-Lindau disease tumor suppressor-like [Chanos chanos]
MAEQEAKAPLRSLHSDVPTFVNFVNKSNGKARAWWLNFSGQPVSYDDISPSHGLKMNTFLTHPWIFRRSETGEKLLVNFNDVYFPAPPEYDEHGFPQYRTVIITTPVYTLQECCSHLIRKLVKKNDILKLDIPEFLRHDLCQTPDLHKEIRDLSASRQT